jgi:hypothetical protein
LVFFKGIRVNGYVIEVYGIKALRIGSENIIDKILKDW